MQTIFHKNSKQLHRDIYYVRVFKDKDGIRRYTKHSTREQRDHWEIFHGLGGQIPLYRINVRRKDGTRSEKAG